MSQNPYQIVDRRVRNKRIEYLVQWDAEENVENTWETRKLLRFKGYMDKIQEYEASQTSTKPKKDVGTVENIVGTDVKEREVADKTSIANADFSIRSDAAIAPTATTAGSAIASSVVTKTTKMVDETKENEKVSTPIVKRGRLRSTSKHTSETKQRASRSTKRSKSKNAKSATRHVLRSQSTKRKTIGTTKELKIEQKNESEPGRRRQSLPLSSPKNKNDAESHRSPRISHRSSRQPPSRLMMASPGPVRVYLDEKRYAKDLKEKDESSKSLIPPESYQGAALFLDKKVYSQLTLAEVFLYSLMGVLILLICLFAVIPQLSDWYMTCSCCHLGFVLLLLLGFLARKDLRFPSRLIEISLLWRAIGAVLRFGPLARQALLLDDFCIGISDLFAVVITIYFLGTKPKRTDALVFSLSLFGVLTLFFTDLILGSFDSNDFRGIRPLLTTFGLVLLSLAAINIPKTKKVHLHES